MQPIVNEVEAQLRRFKLSSSGRDAEAYTVIASIPIPTGSPVDVEITPDGGGWRNVGPPAGPFRNQGQCISFVLHNEHR